MSMTLFKIGSGLVDIGDGHYTYSNNKNEFTNANNYIMLAKGVGTPGCWLNFSVSFSFSNVLCSRGTQDNFQPFIGAAFTTIEYNSANDYKEKGMFFGPVTWMHLEAHVWYTQNGSGGFEDFISFGPHSGTMSIQVIAYHGNSSYDVRFTMVINNTTYSIVKNNLQLNEVNGVCIIGGDFFNAGDSAEMFNVASSALEEVIIPTIKPALCQLNKYYRYSPSFNAGNYDQLHALALYEDARIYRKDGMGDGATYGIFHSDYMNIDGLEYTIAGQWFVSLQFNTGWFGNIISAMFTDDWIDNGHPVETNEYCAWAGLVQGASNTAYADVHLYANGESLSTFRVSNEDVHEYSIKIKVLSYSNGVATIQYVITIVVDGSIQTMSGTFTKALPSQCYIGGYGFYAASFMFQGTKEINVTQEHIVSNENIGSSCRGSLYADFDTDISNGNSPLTVQFTDTSGSDSPIVDWIWDFGDGISTLQNPTRVYTVPGVYTVSLTVTSADGTATVTKQSCIVVAGPKVKKCLQLGFTADQGGGFSERGGDYWVWPESPGSVITVINQKMRQQLVFDEEDGLPYIIDTRDGPVGLIEKSWVDKKDPFTGEGYSIEWNIFFGEYTGELELYHVQLMEFFLTLRAIDKSLINSDGFDENGLPTTFEINASIYKDGKLTETAQALKIPFNRDVHVVRPVDGNAIQIELFGTGAQFKLRKIESFLKVSDRPNDNSEQIEVQAQEAFGASIVWLSRDSKLINRCTGSLLSGEAGCTLGPDGYTDSALTIATPIEFLNEAIGNGTIILWHTEGYAISGITLTPIATNGEWICSVYRGSIPENIVLPEGIVFDVRLFTTSLSDEILTIYTDNIINNNGDVFLP